MSFLANESVLIDGLLFVSSDRQYPHTNLLPIINWAHLIRIAVCNLYSELC